MKSLFVMSLCLLAFTVGNLARAEIYYGVGAGKVIANSSNFEGDGVSFESFSIADIDDANVHHTLLFRLDPKKPVPNVVKRLEDLAASQSGYAVDLNIVCAKPISKYRPDWIYQMGSNCQITQMGHRRAK